MFFQGLSIVGYYSEHTLTSGKILVLTDNVVYLLNYPLITHGQFDDNGNNDWHAHGARTFSYNKVANDTACQSFVRHYLVS